MNWPVSVYRLFDADDQLFYVGCSQDVGTRLSSHRSERDWFPEVVRTVVVAFSTREEALAAELVAIRTEDPMYNVTGKMTENPRDAAVLVRMPAEMRKALKQRALDLDTNVTELLRRAAEDLLESEPRSL
jgi:predicted GIY-YIG superfamily endonuclease